MKTLTSLKNSILPIILCAVGVFTAPTSFAKGLTSSQIIDAASEDDWRTVSQQSLVYMQIGQPSNHADGSREVIFELAEDFAPRHIANLKQLIAEQYFDGLAITRSHDNYVVQWGDPAYATQDARGLGKAKSNLEPEFTQAKSEIPFTPIKSRDAYAQSVGFSNGFAVASNDDQLWLTHCYGALGVGRGMEANSGNGAELYVVTGHAPRHLDRNVTLIGRVIAGIEHLSSLPRGTGALGFYEDKSQYTPIIKIRLGTELTKSEQRHLQVLKTNTRTFQNYVAARTTRQHDWFLDPVGKIEVCNVGIAVRMVP